MKIMHIIYCALIALAAFSAPASAEIVGDANSDGRITTADSLLALRMAVGSMPPDIERADVNHDGAVNSLDALMILTIAQKTQVRVNAPETVSGTFNAAVDIYNVADLDSGQFDLSFDSSVVNVTGVDSGNIDGTTVPISDWRFMDADTIRVLVDLPDADLVSGAGSLTTVNFEITGSAGDNSVLDISNGELFDLDTYGEGIPAIWNDCEVTIGVPVTVNAPEIVSGTFNATIDVADVTNLTSGQFDLSFDPSVVNVTSIDSGSIAGTEVIDMWRLMDEGRIRVLFKLPDATMVSGSGSLATIHFMVTCTSGATSVLDVSNGSLFGLLFTDTNFTSVEILDIPVTWTNGEVTIGVPVTVNAPEIVSGTFNATIDIENVTDLDSGQFDLSFDPSVVNVSDVHDGNIGGTTVPISDWRFMDADTIRVLFDLPDADMVSGSGSLATVNFEMTGSVGNSSVLDISNGELFDLDTYGDGIPAVWNDCEVALKVPVTVNAPEVVSGTFDVTIDITDVTNLDSGQFDLSFDAGVVNVNGIDSGSIGTTEVWQVDWAFRDSDTVRVLFNLPGVTGVSGSGSLATIHFEVTGTAGDTSALNISDGLLVDTESDEMSALWFDDGVTVGVPVTVNAPESVSDAFNATIDIENVTDLDSGQFDLSFDSSVVNVSDVHDGDINGTTVPISDGRFMDADTIRVLFDLPDVDLVSGSGSLATVNFEIIGSVGDTSVLDISNGELFDLDTYSEGIPATWTDSEVTV